MTSDEWNITDCEGEEIICNVIKEIMILKENKIDINNLGKIISKFANFKGIKLKKNGKVRNLNTYIKKKYGGITKFLDLNKKNLSIT